MCTLMQINFKINPLKIILLVVKLKMLYICIYNYLCIYLFNLWLRRTAEKYFMVKQQRRQINREEKKGNFIGILYLSIYSFYLSTYFYLTPNKPERKTFGFFHLKSNVLSSITQQFLNLQICLFYTFSFKMYMPTKKIFKIKGNKIMFKGSNCDRKSQFSEILTEPLNPRGVYVILSM